MVLKFSHFVFFVTLCGVLGRQLPTAASPLPTVAAQPRFCQPQLSTALDTVLAQPQLERARTGVLVQGLGADGVLYAREAERFFLPASTTKLLTTAAALTALGPEHQWSTQVYGTGQSPTLATLRIAGQGDPSFSEKQLQNIAQDLRRQGVRHIQHLVGDDTAFVGTPVVPSWEWEDLQAGWGSPVNSLMVNENAYEVRMYPQELGQPLRLEWQLHPPRGPWRLINRTKTVAKSAPPFTEIVRRLNGDVLEVEIFGQLHVEGNSDRSWMAVIDPGWYFLRRLQKHLATEGISVSRTSLVSDPGQLTEVVGDRSAEQVLFEVKSPPLKDLIYEVNQYSNNLYAEAVLKMLGNARTAHSPAYSINTPTLQQGIKAVREILTDLGVDPSTYDIADGSGLSRHNLISPMALIQTLKVMEQSPHREVFLRSLRARSLGGTPEQPGLIQAKSGGMTGVSNLSGYVRNAEYGPLAFSIFFNQYNQSRQELRQIYDEMLTLLTQLQAC